MSDWNYRNELWKWWMRNYLVTSEQYVKLQKSFDKFIKKLKEEFALKYFDSNFMDKIDKLAGEKLSK